MLIPKKKHVYCLSITLLRLLNPDKNREFYYYVAESSTIPKSIVTLIICNNNNTLFALKLHMKHEMSNQNIYSD